MISISIWLGNMGKLDWLKMKEPYGRRGAAGLRETEYAR
jgi:hypothetical protein